MLACSIILILGPVVTSETQTEPRTTDIDALPLSVPNLPSNSARVPPPLPPLPHTVHNRPPSPIRTSQYSGNYQQDQNFEVLYPILHEYIDLLQYIFE